MFVTFLVQKDLLSQQNNLNKNYIGNKYKLYNEFNLCDMFDLRIACDDQTVL